VRTKAPSPLALCRRSPRRGPACQTRRNCAERQGARLCPARRRISRSASDPQAGLSFFDTVIPAKVLRLVCDTAAVRGRGCSNAARREAPRRFRAGDGPQKLAAHACGQKGVSSGCCWHALQGAEELARFPAGSGDEPSPPRRLNAFYTARFADILCAL
jgi:hypothetical protein